MKLGDRSATILITGATGNIGARLLVELLSSRQSVRVIALVRGSSEQEARNRLNTNLRLIAPDLVDWGSTQSVEVICGDVSEANLGLPEADYRKLKYAVTHVIHAAATTQWHLPLDCARAVNVIGTANMLKFAREAHREGQLRRFSHLSTAYVCGERTGTINEVVHTVHFRFGNTYEQTKWEAEQQVTSLKDVLPVAIIRPSITVGDSRTGLAVTYSALYPPLKYILTGRLTTLTCPPDNHLDLVPVDYVARATAYLTFHSEFESGTIFHLTAGRERSLAISEIVRRALSLVGETCDAHRISYADTADSDSEVGVGIGGGLAALMRLYSSYLQIERDFDDTNTHLALRDSGIALPCLSQYIDTLLATFIDREVSDRRRVRTATGDGGRR